MSVTANLVLPDKYMKNVSPFFKSLEEYQKTRDNFYSEIQPEIEVLNEKRRKSEEAAQVKRYLHNKNRCRHINQYAYHS